jgi:hypothetical protein
MDNASGTGESEVRRRPATFSAHSANTVYGIAFGDAADEILQYMGIPDGMVKKVSSTLDLQEAFGAFSRATSAVASRAQPRAGLTI